jgi:DNA-binding transcriptional LysR family regulator
VRAATASGLGISYSFPELFSDLVEEGSVEELLVDYTQKAFVEIHSFFPALRYTPVRTRAFVDALVDTFGRASTKPD